MAGEVPPLNVEILVSLGNLTSAVNQATEGLNKIGNTAKAQESKFASLKTVMVGTFAGGEIQQGIRMVTDFLKESVKAAEQAQLATTQLATAMNDAKINTEANRKVVEASIGSMEKLAFTHTEATKAMTTLVLATGSATEAQKEMGTVANYARANQMSLSEAAVLLTKASGGAARAFKVYHIELDTSLSKHDALIKAMGELSGKIKDQAAAYLKTYAGQMADLNVKMEKVKETVGAVLLPILRKLAEMFAEVSSFVSKHKDLMIVLIAVIGTALVAALVAAATAAWAMIAPFVAAIAPFAAVAAGVALLWNHFKVFRDVVVDAVKVVITYLGYFIGFIGKMLEVASHLPGIGGHFKGIAAEVNKAAVEVGNFAGKLDALKNKKISLNFSALTPDLAGGASGGAGGSGYGDGGVTGQTITKTKSSTATSKTDAIIQQMDAVLVARQEKMAAAQTTYNDAVANAQTKFNQTKLDLETAHSQKMLDIQKQYADNATQIEQAAADKRQSIIQQSIDLLRSAWESATKINLGSLFTAGNSSATGLQTQLQTQLAQIQKLQEDAGKLAAQGYSQSFIQEVLAQGPQVGDQMAQSVLTAAPDTANSIKTLYDQIQTTSQGGLDGLAAQMNSGSKLATKALVDQYAQVSVDMQKQLDKNTAQLTDALAKENQSFNNSLTKAQQVLTDALTSAQESYNKAIQAISDSSMKQLDALDKKLIAVAGSLKALAALAGLGVTSTGTSIPTGAITAAPLKYTSSNGFSVPNATPQGPGITVNQTNNINTATTTSDITTATLNGITLGQTQGLMTAKPTMSTFQR
jgi:hypothetical protein